MVGRKCQTPHAPAGSGCCVSLGVLEQRAVASGSRALRSVTSGAASAGPQPDHVNCKHIPPRGSVAAIETVRSGGKKVSDTARAGWVRVLRVARRTRAACGCKWKSGAPLGHERGCQRGATTRPRELQAHPTTRERSGNRDRTKWWEESVGHRTRRLGQGVACRSAYSSSVRCCRWKSGAPPESGSLK